LSGDNDPDCADKSFRIGGEPQVVKNSRHCPTPPLTVPGALPSF
jgi:hypothetical protein